MAYSLHYSAQRGEQQFNSLSIDQQGEVTAQMQQAQAGDVPRALGQYALSLGHDDADLKRIEAAIRQHGLLRASVHSITPRPGMRGRIFAIAADGQEITHRLDFFAPLPPEFEELYVLMRTLFERAESAPVRTFAMMVALSPVPIRAGQELRVTISFRNAGSAPMAFRNPAAFAAGGIDAFRLNLWRLVRQEDGAEVPEFDSTLELAGREILIGERRSLRSDQALTRIAGHEQLDAWMTLQLPAVDPDTYLVEAVYYSHPLTTAERQKNPDLLVGDFHAEPIKLTVQP